MILLNFIAKRAMCVPGRPKNQRGSYGTDGVLCKRSTWTRALASACRSRGESSASARKVTLPPNIKITKHIRRASQ